MASRPKQRLKLDTKKEQHLVRHLLIVLSTAALALLAVVPAVSADKPQRIVSLNLCTDQLLMMLAEPQRIAALSYLAQDEGSSVMYEEARKFRVTHAQAEEIFVLEPDLVLVGTFNAASTVAILKRLGKRVEQFSPAQSFADIRKNLQRLGDLIGEREKADALIREFDLELERVRREQLTRKPRAAFYYSNNYTAGDATLANEILQASGMRNIGAELGLSQTTKLPLELLVMANPELIIKDRDFGPPARAQEVFEHPALAYLQGRSNQTQVADKFMICGAPFTINAVKRLVAARKQIERAKAARLETNQQTDGVAAAQ